MSIEPRDSLENDGLTKLKYRATLEDQLIKFNFFNN